MFQWKCVFLLVYQLTYTRKLIMIGWLFRLLRLCQMSKILESMFVHSYRMKDDIR